MKKRITLDVWDIPGIIAKYGVSRASAYRALERGYIDVVEHTKLAKSFGKLTPARALEIARLSAYYVCSRKRIKVGKLWLQDTDLLHEAQQRALIKLWTEQEAINNARDPEAMAFRIGRNEALMALKYWSMSVAGKRDTLCLDDILEPDLEDDKEEET